MGVDVARFLDAAEEMVHSCAPSVPAKDNPGVVLGTILGVLAKQGRDKVTLVTSPGIANLGAWLEQLLAESTGKDGKGLIPVDREPLVTADVYGNDRIFAYIRLESAPDSAQDAAVEALEEAGQPVVRIVIADSYQLGQEFFRWEIATAVAGSIIGINAFNQPDVEASKLVTRQLTAEYEKTGKLPPESPILTADGIQLFTDTKNAAELTKAVGNSQSLADYLRAHLNRLSKKLCIGDSVTRFEEDILKLVTAKTLLLLDRGFYHFSFWLKLIEQKVNFVTRLKKGASIQDIPLTTVTKA
jgi:transaldolase/glucose-6-phosphate isomerase